MRGVTYPVASISVNSATICWKVAEVEGFKGRGQSRLVKHLVYKPVMRITITLATKY